MVTEIKDTPGPLAVSECGVGELFIVKPDGAGGHTIIAEMSKDNDYAHAERLVLCWNCHDELVEACKTITQAKGRLRVSDAHGFQAIARAALAKATT